MHVLSVGISRPRVRIGSCIGLLWLLWFPLQAHCQSLDLQFLKTHCQDCHGDGAAEGGFELSQLEGNLDSPATFAKWVQVFDRIHDEEMPPEDYDQPNPSKRSAYLDRLSTVLSDTHAAKKQTVLRRLNRSEYEYTMNDLFGTHLDLEGMLPEDSRANEFDNVGESLGLSMVHLQRYIDATRLVLDAAIADRTEAPEPAHIVASYKGSREGDQFIGKIWKQLDDGAVVRFSGGGYPSGMLRGSSVRQPGRYRVRVTGYAYQSDEAITFSVGGTSFARGSEKPIYGYWSFAPGGASKTQQIEFETWIDKNYMLAIEPYGIFDPERYQRKSIEGYDGPGLAILEVTLDGPLLEQWPSQGHRLIFDNLQRQEIEPANPAQKKKSWYKPKFEIVTDQETRDIQNVLNRVCATAFRRPVEDSDSAEFLQLYTSEREAGDSIEDALKTTVTAIFCSPRFLFLDQPQGKLDSYALASRLSYFLTRSTPDAQLLAAAEDGSLLTDEGLARATNRLLESELSERFLVDWTDNWLDLRDMDFTVPDQKLFPEFDDYLRYSMPLETRAFLRELIDSNLSIVHLVKSDFAMLNSRLAEHYALPQVIGSEVRKVSLPPGHVRGGLLTQAAVLKVTANGTNTSPVKRGAWVLDRILDTPPSPPPPGIPGVEPDIRGASTLRELLDKHRNVQSCQACHEKIDPPGFALESFNPIGGFRERYRSIGGGDRVDLQINGRRVNYRLGPEVDSSGQLGQDKTFDNYQQFRDLLASNPEQLTRAFATKLLTFATGRELGFSDRAIVNDIVSRAESQGLGVRDIIHLVVQSEIFRSK